MLGPTSPLYTHGAQRRLIVNFSGIQ